MLPFTEMTGSAASLLRANIDTDVIIRIERLTSVPREQLGRYAFEALRYRADGSENPDFVLNHPIFRSASILIAGANFGCGSSREGAVWALMAAGLRCVIAESFGDIFYNNCFQNGLLPITLSASSVRHLADQTGQGAPMTVDLVRCAIVTAQNETIPFEIDAARRQALIEGLDDISRTLRQKPKVVAWQSEDRTRRPWIWQLPAA
ncbi:3-isopropylmalate dehydratase small subunit [Bradyrhizobium sp. Ai1a-2]|uniref:3-isopropylmalate dehydratase small subunit n=1 Tax=Bradyrhizobium sp. Ai1a-2 TaxID=196490 RepID=UPI0003F784E2|nr:3-isopropylmalate dehydratase small subunit [Bradyrhizobium sp. Ai1a-2]